MKPTHKGIAFNAVDAANNLNGTKTRHLIRVGNAVYRKALFGYIAHSDCHEDTAIAKEQYIADYLNANAPYKPGDVVYQKETFTPLHKNHVITRECVYKAEMGSDSEEIRQEYIRCGYDYRWRPAQHMPIKYARLWLQIASCTAVQVDGVWMWETIYSKTEKPIV